MRNLAGNLFRTLLVSTVALTLGGCGSSSEEDAPPVLGGTESWFEVPATLDALDDEAWFNHPWPSDMRVDADGSIRLLGYPNPRAIPILDAHIETMVGALHGFSPAAAGYMRFTGPIDIMTLPLDPGQSVLPTASVQMIDVDPSSPEIGSRHLVTLYWRALEGAYWVPNTLAFMPTMGFPLRPSTRYAVVVTNGVLAEDGTLMSSSSDLRRVLGLDPPDATTQALHDEWAPAIDAVANTGIPAENIVHLTVFTTNDPTAEAMAVADDAKNAQPPPTVEAGSWALTDQGTSYDVYEGRYGPLPDYQAGTPPFESFGEGGAFSFDGNGKPIKQRDIFTRFALAVPNAAACPLPATGYPIVLYAHGTYGDYQSFLSTAAGSLAEVCLASMGVDQIMHGDRLPPGGSWDPGLLFFNFQNIDAARTNQRQSAIDDVARTRLFREGLEIPASVSSTGGAIPFDPGRILFYGHSQGGITGPLIFAIDDGIRGGVLSGAGAMLAISLLEKTKPTPSVAGLVKTLLFGLKTSEYEELNELHPGMTLVQTMVDAVDPIHYAPWMIRSPRSGFPPKSVYQSEGVNPDFTGDSYTPPHSAEVLAVASGLPLMNPVIHPVAEMAFSGLAPVTIPSEGLAGNLAGGLASGVLAQWPASQASDGHFVVSQIPAALTQAAGFCRNLADEPAGRIPPP